MLRPSRDGSAAPRGRSESLVLHKGDLAGAAAIAFVQTVRTRSTNIIGFAEMLADERLTLTDAQRDDYAGIVRTEGIALNRDLQMFLTGRG